MDRFPVGSDQATFRSSSNACSGADTPFTVVERFLLVSVKTRRVRRSGRRRESPSRPQGVADLVNAEPLDLGVELTDVARRWPESALFGRSNKLSENCLSECTTSEEDLFKAQSCSYGCRLQSLAQQYVCVCVSRYVVEGNEEARKQQQWNCCDSSKIV